MACSNSTSTVGVEASEYVVDILLDDHPIQALLDTGASHSFVDLGFITSKNIPNTTVSCDVGLGAHGAQAQATGKTLPLRCIMGSKACLAEFFVMRLPQWAPKCILGRDLLPEFGVSLLLPPLGLAPLHSEVSSVDVPSTFNSTPPLPDKVQCLLDENQPIPTTSRCTHPDSIIPLDTGDSEPTFRRQYRVPEAMAPRVTEMVKEWLRDGVITTAPAGCKWNNPLLVVSNPPDIRLCIDPRPLNACLRSGDNFQIPVISELIDRLSGATFFSSLDLKKGFHQFTIREQDRPKLAFTWDSTQYMFVGAPFGVKPLSSAFQRVLSSLFADKTFVIVYIDHIYVFSLSF